MRGATEGDAINRGDLAVRQTHGSSVMSNKPSVMRTNAFGALYTSLYSFFSHMFQKQYEMAWKAKDAVGLAKQGEYVYRWQKGLERPKGPWDISTGLRYGSTKGHSRSLEDYLRHTVGLRLTSTSSPGSTGYYPPRAQLRDVISAHLRSNPHLLPKGEPT